MLDLLHLLGLTTDYQTVEFDLNVFLPVLPAAVTELLRLISEADTVESKRRILGTLNVVIERAGQHVSGPMLHRTIFG